MTSVRTVRGVRPSAPHHVADLVTRSPLDDPGSGILDPFLLLAHHGPQRFAPGNAGLPFGPHPHRGFETITYVVSGALAHDDSGSNATIVHAGGVQWMTAGAGIVHSEDLSPELRTEGGDVEFLQLWLNLPSALKMTRPRYQERDAKDIPRLMLGEGAALELFAGAAGEICGPFSSLTDTFLSVLRLDAGGATELWAPQGRSVLFYVVSGRGRVCGADFAPWELVAFGDDGASIIVEADAEAIILFGHADPIREPLVARGPFVMNNAAEIESAIADHRAGRLAIQAERI